VRNLVDVGMVVVLVDFEVDCIVADLYCSVTGYNLAKKRNPH
jgi:hypothetical protein